jgi:hypothetical protein
MSCYKYSSIILGGNGFKRKFNLSLDFNTPENLKVLTPDFEQKNWKKNPAYTCT